jgi:general secretion pathway protein J
VTTAKPTRQGPGRAAACAIRTKVRPNGFTLIELVIALALVALITVLLFSGLRLGSRAWDGVDTVAERNAELRSARGFLDRTLSQARDLVLRYDAQDHQVFAGDATSLEFVAPLSEHVGIPGLYVLRLGLEGGSKDARLVLTRWLLHPDVLSGNAEAPEWQPLEPGSPGISSDPKEETDMSAGAFGQTALLEDVGVFELAYYGVAEEAELNTAVSGQSATRKSTRSARAEGDGPEEEGQWYEEWTKQPHPPKLIRVRLTSRRQDWPDSVVRLPQVDQAAGAQIQTGSEEAGTGTQPSQRTGTQPSQRTGARSSQSGGP